jgi:hypothetical protein
MILQWLGDDTNHPEAVQFSSKPVLHIHFVHFERSLEVAIMRPKHNTPLFVSLKLRLFILCVSSQFE